MRTENRTLTSAILAIMVATYSFPTHANSLCSGLNNGAIVGLYATQISACTVMISDFQCTGVNSSFGVTVGIFTKRSPECEAG